MKIQLATIACHLSKASAVFKSITTIHTAMKLIKVCRPNTLPVLVQSQTRTSNYPVSEMGVLTACKSRLISLLKILPIHDHGIKGRFSVFIRTTTKAYSVTTLLQFTRVSSGFNRVHRGLVGCNDSLPSYNNKLFTEYLKTYTLSAFPGSGIRVFIHFP